MILSTFLLGALAPTFQADTPRGPQPILPHFEESTARTRGPAAAVAQSAPRAASRPGTLERDPVLPEALNGLSLRDIRDPQQVYMDQPQGTDWWVRGHSYKARFGADGVQYIPYLGSDAPKNYPVSMRIVGAYAGDEPIQFDADVAAEAGSSEVTFDRGSFLERYLLEPESIEQTFIFHEVSREELRVEIALDTELEADLGAGTGMRFSNARGGVQFSGAFALDARGRRLELSTEMHAHSYSITVPQSFLASAEFPLTIDPVISTFFVDSITAPLTNPKTAYSPSTESWLVVYSEDFSATDGDIYSAEVSSFGSVNLVGYVDITSDRWFSPDVGCARADETLLVAAAAEIGGPGVSTVQGRLYDPATFTYGSAFRVDTGDNDPKDEVSVGGDPLDRFLVVWQREFSPGDRDVHARVVTSGGVPLGTSNIFLDNFLPDYVVPHCSKHNRTTNNIDSAWAVVAQRNIAGLSEIWGAQIRWTGEIEHVFTQLSSSTQPDLNPRVSSPLEQSGDPVYAVVWERDFGDLDLEAALFSSGSSQQQTSLTFGGLAGPDPFDDEAFAAIDSNGTAFALTWVDGSSGSQQTTYVSSLVLELGDLCISENAVIDSSGGLRAGGVAARPSDDSHPLYLLAFEDTFTSPSEDIYGTLYQADELCFEGTSTCTPAVTNSSGLPAVIAGAGSNFAGGMVQLRATQLPTSQFGFFIVSRTASNPFTPPGSQGNLCLTGDIGRFNSSILNSGSGGQFELLVDTGDLPFSSGTSVLSGESLNFSAWFRDNNPGPTSNFSDVLRASFL